MGDHFPSLGLRQVAVVFNDSSGTMRAKIALEETTMEFVVSSRGFDMAETANARIMLWPLRCQCLTMREETGRVEDQPNGKAEQKTVTIARGKKSQQRENE